MGLPAEGLNPFANTMAPELANTAPAAAAGGSTPDQVPADAPRVLAGFLVSFEEAELGLFWPLYQGANAVGRKGATEGTQVEIDHPTTSSRHATVFASARPGRVMVEDHGSTNGTYFRDQKLQPGQRVEVRDGEVVRFGGFPVTLRLVG